MRPFTRISLTIALLALGGQLHALEDRSGSSVLSGATAGATTEAPVIFQGGGMTLEQAVAQVRRQYPGGKIVSAETRTSGGRETHVIKVLTSDGTVKTVRVPGRSG
jgi:hypothetical protein